MRKFLCVLSILCGAALAIATLVGVIFGLAERFPEMVSAIAPFVVVLGGVLVGLGYYHWPELSDPA